MGKPIKRASKAVTAKNLPTSSSENSVKPAPVEPIQRTKDKKRQARHDAFLKSIDPNVELTNILEIHDKKSTKRPRKRQKKMTSLNLLSLESSLEDIMKKDQQLRSRKIEISIRPKGKAIQKEVERFKAVMQHPEFKVNPLKAIRQHVENTWERKEGMRL
jgi:Ribosome biogenesis protein SLX9